ncbi:MAG: DUF1772 domain-containing protein [Pseudomonadales bacterium]|nr:DUF1772 domain-containing protein [Pseudomonadales bacterium]
MFQYLLVIATVGSGLVAGLFFIFSNCVMFALNEQPPKQAVLVMQSINEIILNRYFFVLFMGMPILCIAIFWVGSISNNLLPYGYSMMAAIIYIIGSFGITMRKNVPMNNQLKTIDVDDLSSLLYWQTYFVTWNRWNHIRFLSSLVASLLFAINLLSLQG